MFQEMLRIRWNDMTGKYDAGSAVVAVQPVERVTGRRPKNLIFFFFANRLQPAFGSQADFRFPPAANFFTALTTCFPISEVDVGLLTPSDKVGGAGAFL